ncbi:CRISPR-associated endonuclease Cas1 [Neolewinella agarilytica]|uniref:CRISPR-associated endonuclease Cas1 n=1 Tax=Neolewinella agarilytica TaxID=478744 RepID=A0A1H9HCX3_9BACT|nr:CRISPR-associated endonuclease Cas1 [Neolewinella agarilytica]SEQ60076.1 CRISP-associated protein Cas1 [Neolewinella agarilytica]
MQLVLHTHGLRLDVAAGIFHLTDGEHERSISPELIDSISVLSGDCLLTARAVRLAAAAEVPIYFHDDFGEADACLRSAYFESLARRRRGQVYFSDSVAGAAWVVAQFLLKTDAQVDNLRYLSNRRKKHSEELGAAAGAMEKTKEHWEALAKQKPSPKWASQVMGHEGAIARTYWQALSAALPAEWQFAGRSRRPAQDPYNALTNYCYGILYARVERTLFAAGLDPHLGILHADEYDRPTLAYDLIEPFRPWVDRFLLQQILQFKLDLATVEARDGGWWITHAAKKELVPNFNQYFQGLTLWRGQRAKREGQIYRHAQDLARTIDSSTQRPN